MPDKRQTSKQRRAARNRAQRDALAARRENAGVATTRPASSSTSSAATGTTAGAATTAAAPAARTGKGRRRPGDMALIVALGLSLVAFVLLLNTDIPVDDRGEALPATFGGVAIEARAALTDGPIVDESENIVSYYGPLVVALMAVPLVVVTIVFVLARRWQERSRLLTFAMLGLAGVVVLTGTFGFYYMPALIALAVASFQVRKLEMPNRVTQPRPARGAAGRRGAIDVDPVDDDAEDDEDDEVATPAPSTRSRRSGGRSRRSASTAPVEDGAPDSYEDGDVYDPDTGVKEARPAAIDADVVDADLADAGDLGLDGDVTDEPEAGAPAPADDRPAPGRSRGGLRRRGRPSGSPTADAGVSPAAPAAEPEPEPTPYVSPSMAPGVTPDVTSSATNGQAVAPDPTETPDPDPDDILAELEEELRREAEADEDDDPPTRR